MLLEKKIVDRCLDMTVFKASINNLCKSFKTNVLASTRDESEKYGRHKFIKVFAVLWSKIKNIIISVKTRMKIV
jgi:hypothetical protein